MAGKKCKEEERRETKLIGTADEGEADIMCGLAALPQNEHSLACFIATYIVIHCLPFCVCK